MLVRRAKNQDDCVTLAPGFDFRAPVYEEGTPAWQRSDNAEERKRRNRAAVLKWFAHTRND